MKHQYRPITHTEMCAFIGLNVLRAFYSDRTVTQLFDQSVGPAIYRATMGGKRFAIIQRNGI